MGKKSDPPSFKMAFWLNVYKILKEKVSLDMKEGDILLELFEQEELLEDIFRKQEKEIEKSVSILEKVFQKEPRVGQVLLLDEIRLHSRFLMNDKRFLRGGEKEKILEEIIDHS